MEEVLAAINKFQSKLDDINEKFNTLEINITKNINSNINEKFDKIIEDVELSA